MCEQDQTPVKRVVSALSASGLAGTAKASPGLAVAGMSIYGVPIETWVSVLTCLYLLFMIFGTLPKVIDSIRYLVALTKKSKSIVEVNQHSDSSDLNKAIQKAKK